MSVVVRRDHPSGVVGLSVASFPEDEKVVLGIGPLKDMKFFNMTPDEAYESALALSQAAYEADAK